MATLTIRKLDDGVYRRLRERAEANGRSLEAEARRILSDNAPDAEAAIQKLRAFQQEMRAKHGMMPDSLPLIRAERDDE
jgi:plasmid stability protein